MPTGAPGFVLPPPPVPSAAVAGTTDRFPLRRIFCVGRNYADHAREMGGDPDREPPFFFTKPADAALDSGATLPYPPATADLHFEAELVIALGQGGAFVPEAQAAPSSGAMPPATTSPAATSRPRRRPPAAPGTWPRALTPPP